LSLHSVQINTLKHPDKSLYQSKPLGQLQNRHGPLLGPMLRFTNFFNSALQQNFNNAFNMSLLLLEHRFLSFFKSALSQNFNKAISFELMIIGAKVPQLPVESFATEF